MRRVVPLIALVVATNIAMLASARANRAGDPEVLRVTERELRREMTSDRDTSVKLRLTYEAALNWRNWRETDAAARLGFTCRTRTAAGAPAIGPCGLRRRLFIALEYDGPAWQAIAAQRLRERNDLIERVRQGDQYARTHSEMLANAAAFGTRLVAIDASPDAAALRRAHPEGRVIILPAVGHAWVTLDGAKPLAEPAITGVVDPLTTTLMAAGRDRDQLLEIPADRYPYSGSPRYSVDLRVGRRRQPWIQDVSPIDSPTTPH